MKKKIICIGVVSMFLLTSISAITATAIETNTKNENSTGKEIRITVQGFTIGIFTGFPPPTIDARKLSPTITITNIDTGEMVMTLTKDDMSYYYFGEFGSDYAWWQAYEIYLDDGAYNLHCSIEISGKPYPSKDIDFDFTVPGCSDNIRLVFNRRPHEDISPKLYERFPILQQLLQKFLKL
jgi:hypothetical protein